MSTIKCAVCGYKHEVPEDIDIEELMRRAEIEYGAAVQPFCIKCYEDMAQMLAFMNDRHTIN